MSINQDQKLIKLSNKEDLVVNAEEREEINDFFIERNLYKKR